MSTDIYKIKYIKYKKKYNELKKIKLNVNDIVNKTIILPKEFSVLSQEQQQLFILYEKSKSNLPLSYIKKDYGESILNIGGNNFKETESSSSEQLDQILEKNIISPDEYFILQDSDKAKYEIFESDYNKFPNRVVPKNYKKI